MRLSKQRHSEEAAVKILFYFFPIPSAKQQSVMLGFSSLEKRKVKTH